MLSAAISGGFARKRESEGEGRISIVNPPPLPRGASLKTLASLVVVNGSEVTPPQVGVTSRSHSPNRGSKMAPWSPSPTLGGSGLFAGVRDRRERPCGQKRSKQKKNNPRFGCDPGRTRGQMGLGVRRERPGDPAAHENRAPKWARTGRFGLTFDPGCRTWSFLFSCFC